MKRFEDQLWSDLVNEYGDRVRRAPAAVSDLAGSLDAGRGRPTPKRRFSRFAAALGMAVVAGAALALGLVGVLGRDAVHGGAPSSALRAIHTPSYTLISNTSGTVTLTIHPQELFDPAALQSDLAHYGIPSMVTSGSFCSSDPTPAGFSQVVSLHPGGEFTVQGPATGQVAVTFDPSAIPAGAELSIGDFQLPSGQQQADLGLISTSSSTCTSDPAAAWSADEAGALYGGQAGS